MAWWSIRNSENFVNKLACLTPVTASDRIAPDWGSNMKATRIALLFVLACACAWGQATSQIQGVVTDATGAAVPGAEVKATQTDTATTRTATTGADGGYVLSNLAIGPYRLEVTKQGFTSYVQTGIVLQVASTPTVDVSLKVGAISDQVQVEEIGRAHV